MIQKYRQSQHRRELLSVVIYNLVNSNFYENDRMPLIDRVDTYILLKVLRYDIFLNLTLSISFIDPRFSSVGVV